MRCHDLEMAKAEVRRIDAPSTSMRVPKVAELIADDLRRKIIRGQLPVGDTLPNETTLLENYNVSRPTLREALRLLESEGLVSVKRGAQGGRVHVPDISVAARHVALQMQVRGTTMEDLFAARRVIEPGAVRILAEAKSKATVKALRQQVDAELALLDQPDAYASAATMFHEMLIQLAGNNTLTIFSELVLEIVDRHHHDTFARASGLERAYTEEAHEHHQLVVDLIERGDAEEAEAFWRRHIEGAATRAVRHLGPKTIVDLLG
jgi:DNA-binding FadR family transcriptional regulator